MNTLPNRLARLSTALLTVWCLGCSSFDVLLAHVFGRTGASVVSCMTAADTPTDALTMMSVSEREIARDAIGCGCDHCVALRTVASMQVRAPSPEVQIYLAVIDIVRSVEPIPLVPPPLA